MKPYIRPETVTVICNAHSLAAASQIGFEPGADPNGGVGVPIRDDSWDFFQ